MSWPYKPRPDAPWTASERERQAIALAGGRVLANRCAGGDHALIYWAHTEGRLVWIDAASGSPLGNPWPPKDHRNTKQRAASIDRYTREHFPKVRHLVGDLCPPGSVLGCWCFPVPCHGDVILDALVELAGAGRPELR